MHKLLNRGIRLADRFLRVWRRMGSLRAGPKKTESLDPTQRGDGAGKDGTREAEAKTISRPLEDVTPAWVTCLHCQAEYLHGGYTWQVCPECGNKGVAAEDVDAPTGGQNRES